MNTLSENDAALYYKLWLPLLDFVNSKKHAAPSLRKIAGASSLDAQEVKKVANALWDDTGLIDQYLSGKSDLPKEHKEIIRSWKRRLNGTFFMERHLKNGSIFIDGQREEVYQVCGIISSWEEMFFWQPMPVYMEATLIPFQDVIISDGLNIPYNVVIGPNIKRNLKDVYMNAKREKRIHRSL